MNQFLSLFLRTYTPIFGRRRAILKASVAACIYLLCWQIEAQNQPNILLIYTDQQRYNTIHRLGNEKIKTPNLDKLVEGGTAFTNAFVTAPVCTPSRWSLHSGMYTTTHQTYSNHHVARKRPPTSLPLELKKRGYKTVLLGKNHCFLNETDLDINSRVAVYKNALPDLRNAENAMAWNVEEDPEHQVTNQAIEILKNTKGAPVFMWLSYIHPHTPYHCPEPYFSMYDQVDLPQPATEKKGLKKAGKPFRQQFHQINNDNALPYDEAKTMRMKQTYYGMISMIDAEIGRLIRFLEENNLRDNTIIVFTSDHGDYMGDHGLYTKSPAMYDCLVRVPLIFNYPAQVKAGQITDELVSCVDIMPTLLEMIEIRVPEQVQGLSLLKVLKGESAKVDRDYVFAEYGIPGKPILEEELQERMPDYQERTIYYSTSLPWEANPVGLAGRFRMIRSKEYKLVEEIGGTNEFYDLRKDPNELKNQFGKRKYKAIQKKMLKALHEWKNALPGIERDTEPIGEKNFANYLKNRS